MSQNKNRKVETSYSKNKYDKNTYDVYQIISAYVVDFYYNHLYAEGTKLKYDGKVPSITIGYKHVVLRFISVIDQNSKTYKVQFYTRLLEGILDFFKTFSGDVLTMSDCINKITEQFIPSDYFPHFDADQKRNVLRNVLINSMKSFSRLATNEFIVFIIDKHDDPDSIELLKEKMMDCLFLQREEMYNTFLNSTQKKSEVVDKDLAVKMQQDIKKISKENDTLIQENKKLKEENHTIKNNSMLLLDKYKELLKRYKSIKEQMANLRERQTQPIDDLIIDYSAVNSPEQIEEQSEISVQDMNTLLDRHTKKPTVVQPKSSQPLQAKPVPKKSDSNADKTTVEVKGGKNIKQKSERILFDTVEDSQSETTSESEISEDEKPAKRSIGSKIIKDDNNLLSDSNFDVLSEEKQTPKPNKNNQVDEKEQMDQISEKLKSKPPVKTESRIKSSKNILGDEPSIGDVY